MRDNVELLYWDNKKSTGHVSLKISTITDKKTIYISYWPIKNTCCKSTPQYHSEEEDEIEEEVPPTKSVSLTELGLNTHKMIERFHQIKESNTYWCLCAECIPHCIAKNSYANCSTLVMHLLEEGGIQDHLPSRAKFGSFMHILLLCSSRVFITTSLLACGIYPVIEDNLSENNHIGNALLGTIMIVLLNGTAVFLLEKKFVPRQVAEINYKDCIVGIAASLGFGTVALLDKWLERTTSMDEFLFNFGLLQNLKLAKAIYHFSFLFFGTLLGLYTGGKVASCLVGLITLKPFQGTAYTISPNNIEGWMDYMKQVIDKKIKHFITATEVLSSFLTLYGGWAGCITIRQLGMRINFLENWFQSGILALYVGISLGGGMGYLITKYLISRLEKRLNLKKSEIKEQYGQSLERFSLTTLMTCFGVLTAISLCSNIDALNTPIMDGIVGTVGGIIGFLLGTGCCKLSVLLYQGCNKTKSTSGRVPLIIYEDENEDQNDYDQDDDEEAPFLNKKNNKFSFFTSKNNLEKVKLEIATPTISDDNVRDHHTKSDWSMCTIV